ncbi:hypothetical protein PUNSTDRAFT_44304 [Punctularia strigosozonata HHB-11173 SS5]|uniref:uncharacterized protein n=1 Tax=Punctularia strigosozonata (strain HHB-11173) TaxID=741275 RepID=UPI0004418092|nr:uncharacterized protein PUNSTDRAFT_44304 [Punctularia strigosozonata HHB-11173 SS5]EIN08745.1 hypothetical protein PUNSTDRAFT_44304 [Punctularia strigosozonata HHB-11173 SS5]
MSIKPPPTPGSIFIHENGKFCKRDNMLDKLRNTFVRAGVIKRTTATATGPCATPATTVATKGTGLAPTIPVVKVVTPVRVTPTKATIPTSSSTNNGRAPV